MADTFYATLELKNIRMDGFLFSFPGKYRHNAIFCDRIWRKKTYEFSSQWHFKNLASGKLKTNMMALISMTVQDISCNAIHCVVVFNLDSYIYINKTLSS